MTSGKDFQIGAMSGISAYQQAQMTRAQEKLRAAQAPSNGENVSDKLQGKESVGEVKKAAQQFEALLLQQMMKAMWRTVPKGGMLSGSNEEGMFRDMLNESLADEISKGQGVGIKQVLEREFLKYEK